MEHSNLLALLEEDRGMILASIERDRSPAAAQAVLEKALDRLALRAAEQYRDAEAREAAQLALSSLKSALPLLDAVGEVRRWQRSTTDAKGGRRAGTLAWIALAGGALLALAAVLGLAFSAGRGGLLTPVRALLPVALGLAAVFWAGTRFAKPAKSGVQAPSDVRDEFLVDPERVWHHLRGMVLVADGALDGLEGRRSARRVEAERRTESGPLDRAQVELFAGLLENVYAQEGEDAREMAESIRFFLHGAQVEVEDYAPGRESWFEFLPAQRPGTIRPALVSGGRLIKKGMASA